MALLSADDVAARLGISPCRVRVLIRAGRIRARKQWGCWVVREEDLAAYVPQPEGWPLGRKRGVGAPAPADVPGL